MGITIARRYIEALVEGGVPDHEQRLEITVNLLELSGESPEVDGEAMSEITLRAARVIFADGLALADTDLPYTLEIDAMIRELDDQRARAVTMDETEQSANGLQSDEWYCGAMEGLQSLRKRLVGTILPTRRSA